MIVKKFYDIGIVVVVDEGFVVLVVWDVDCLIFVGIEKEIGDFVKKVRNNKLIFSEF